MSIMRAWLVGWLCCGVLRYEFQRAQVVLDKVGLDHCQLLLCLDYNEARTPKYFKSELNWLEHPDLLNVISRVWKTLEDDCAVMPDFLMENLNDVREALIKWSKVELPNSAKQIDKLLRDLKQCDDGSLTEA
ncbi:reverse transcriptase [Senna tora]|uniref:Reverse transcriptase n=1 Tax=Senna tora TaxID=362788 RepID=A0A834X088_9FABA|nr:reverse transcriptase [Senna tora]